MGALYSHFKGKEDKERFLREQFEAQNPEMIAILEQYEETQSLDLLRDRLNAFVTRSIGPDHYRNLRDAINGLYEKGMIKLEEREQLRKLNLHADKYLLAAWDTYTILKDEGDLAHTFLVLCDVKNRQHPSEAPGRGGGAPGGFGISAVFQPPPQQQPHYAEKRVGDYRQDMGGEEEQHRSAGGDSLERDEAQEGANPQFYDSQNQPPQFLKLLGQPEADKYRAEAGELQRRNSPQMSQ
mmetsp:Transcript_2351/g.3542  ORF Transcript_2351/g.3542 Transcript_2351/m.3542 type:complete len:239 (+) Transcript_2351:3525-4241(+)